MPRFLATKIVQGLAALAIALGFMAPSNAIAEDAPAVNNGKVSLSIGFEVTTDYIFRGLHQENQGLIVQPSAEVGFQLTDKLSASIGTWMSIHDNNTFASGGSTVPSWYEADFYFGFSYQATDRTSVGISYTALTAPNDAFGTVEELAFSLSYDDSGRWDGVMGLPEGFAFNPSITLIIELDGQADGGTDEGIVLLLGIAPEFEVTQGKYPITLTVPVTVGLGFSDYYENPATGGDDDTFGFIDIGLDFSMPLSEIIPGDYGEWTLTVGVHFIWVGDNVENFGGPGAITNGDDSFIYGKFGISMSY